MAFNYGFIWGQPEALVASTLFGGVRHAAANLLLLLLMGQAMCWSTMPSSAMFAVRHSKTQQLCWYRSGPDLDRLRLGNYIVAGSVQA